MNRIVAIQAPRDEMVRSLKAALAACGMRGVRAGASLEDTIEQVHPDAVVVDGVWSAGDALSSCGVVRRAEATAATPILLVVSPGDVDTVERAIELGVTSFAEMPVSPEILALRIRAILGDTQEPRHAAVVREQAARDSLTGLSSRPSFMRTMNRVLARAAGDGEHAALLYLDLDRFKPVNDALGHAVGDALLQKVARIIETQVRATDVIGTGEIHEGDVSRLGGDEFTVLLSKVARPEDAGDVAQRILGAMRLPFSVDGYKLATTASIGIAIFPEDGDDAEKLLRCADMAMYSAKASGRGNYRFYQPAMGELHSRRLEVEQRLRYALDRNELEVRYQPRIDLREDRIAGMEALVRWNSQELCEVQPKEFIPVAEESGLIVAIGAWVLERACAQLAEWQAAGLSGLRLSVNLSSQQIESSDVVKTVTDVLRTTGVEPQQLELEVTERLMLGGDENTALALRDLAGIGVTLALDDFGTGFSSLSCITRFPFDVLKIDRSIASEVESDPAAASIVTAVVTLARSLGLGIVAEGVDSLGQARMLTALGCDELQGFLVSPALSAKPFAAFCRDWKGLESCVPGPGDA